MAWIITSSARVEQYCGYIYKANSFNGGLRGLPIPGHKIGTIIPVLRALNSYRLPVRSPEIRGIESPTCGLPNRNSGIYGAAEHSKLILRKLN